MGKHRWEHCIYHLGAHTTPFLNRYLPTDGKAFLLIGGAGFDPRSAKIAEIFQNACPKSLEGVFFREERPNPDQLLIDRAEANQKILQKFVPQSQIHKFDVFAPDGAVVGGRKAVDIVDKIDLNKFTDIFVDFSALSIGISFPIVRHLCGKIYKTGNCKNLHVVVVNNPSTDLRIASTPSEDAVTMLGFMGGWGLQSRSDAARLWIPQLVKGKRTILERIYQRTEPHAVCPILPFPSSNPRLPDELMNFYQSEFQNAWQVDSRDVVYADEKSPLDLYRAILRIDEARQHVFSKVGGSQIVLSPIGSKALAIGALMASIERDFTVMYVETLYYNLLAEVSDGMTVDDDIVHVWLTGEAYVTAKDKA